MKELIEQLRCDADVFQNMKQGGFACYLVAKRYNDAADALEKMEAENAQLRRERDAAVDDFKELAKHLVREINFSACRYCAKNATCQDDCDFEWRGVQNHIADPGKGVQEEI